MVQNQITLSLCLTLYFEAVRSAILATAWLLVLFTTLYYTGNLIISVTERYIIRISLHQFA